MVVTDVQRRRVRSEDQSVTGLLVQGPRSAPDAPLLVCIHGGGCNGGYFDLKGCSTVEAAVEGGLPVLLVDRPGYGQSAPFVSPNPITETGALIRAFIDDVRSKSLPESRDILMIGHSIGGAVVLTMAAERGAWPLRGIAVSGIGDQPPAPAKLLGIEDDQPRFEPSQRFTEALFFDPEAAYSWKVLASLRTVAEPWLTAEVIEVIERWPDNWPMLAPQIDVPVHIRLAEHERIWISGEDVIARMTSKISAAPIVDAALLLGGGHLYEVTRHGPQFIASQLRFLLDQAQWKL